MESQFELTQQHQRKCQYHKNRPRHCSAKTRDGFPCLTYVSYRQSSDCMPMCRNHRKQYLKAGHCVGLEPCGYPCGTLIPWKALPELQLCDEHREKAPCCFLQRLPVEVRYEIYSYLFPDRLVSAQKSSSVVRHDRNGLNAILLVNRQIYSEARVILYQKMQFEIYITKQVVAIANISHSRVQKSSESFVSCAFPGTGLMVTLNQTLWQLKSLSSYASNIAMAATTTPTQQPLWKNFPVKESLWRRMRRFRIEIVLPHLPDRGSSSEAMFLLLDMIHRVVEYIGMISSHIRSLDIILDLFPISPLPLRDQSRIIGGLLRHLWRVWDMKKLKLYLAFTSNQAHQSLFNVLEDPYYKIQGFFQDESSVLQEQLKECRTRITQHQSAGSCHTDHFQPPLVIPRFALYQLEVALEAIYHPLVFSYINRQGEQQLQAAHHLAIKAVLKQDLQEFRGACDQILKVLDAYIQAQANLTQIIARNIQGIRNRSGTGVET